MNANGYNSVMRRLVDEIGTAICSSKLLITLVPVTPLKNGRSG